MLGFPPDPPPTAAPAVAGVSGTGGASFLTAICCPRVQKFVVIQYTIKPAGKLGMIAANMSGNSNMMRCCVLSIVTDITRLAPTWDPT